MNRLYAFPSDDPLERFRAQLTPEYWSDLFCRSRGDLSRLRGSKEFDEFYAASAFAWWIQVRDGVECSFRLLDTRGIGEPDCEFTHQDGLVWVEIFGLHFPGEKLDREGAVHRLDRLVRERLQAFPFPITTEYASHKDLPMDGRLRLLARQLGDELARQLSSADEAIVEAPVRVKAKRSQMAMVVAGTTDIATPARAREAFAAQMRKQLSEALNKLRKHGAERGCVLIVTDQTNAPGEVAAAFLDVEASLYSECGGVFWLNSAKRPFTLKSLHEKPSLFGGTVRA